MSERPFSVCVFCASSEAVSAEHRAVAAALGRAIAERGWRVVYGGGGIGLMGEVARGALNAGGQVLGVIPHRLATREVALPEVTELVRTDTMRERKHRMDLESDAFIVLPGGIGTLEELVEILTLKQLGYHDRPIVVLDAGQYWKPLLDQFAAMIAAELSPASILELFEVAEDPDAALGALAHPHQRAGVPGPGEELEVIEEEFEPR
jgi:cytokinin riboside 5'-monophosphate phosphoribohydrolase